MKATNVRDYILLAKRLLVLGSELRRDNPDPALYELMRATDFAAKDVVEFLMKELEKSNSALFGRN